MSTTKSKNGGRQYSFGVVAFLLALGGVLMGLDTSSISVFMSLDDFKNYFRHPDSFMQGIMAASNPAGAFCMSFYIFENISEFC